MPIFHPYGIFIALAIFAAYLVARFRLKSYDLTSDQLDSLFLWIIPPAIIGARLYHVIDKFSYYQTNPVEIIAVWYGGLGIYGAVAGGLIGIFLFSRKSDKANMSYKANKILDLLVPSVLIAQAIGRIGNYFNFEVFGGPTNLPWGWFIPEPLRPSFWKNFSYFHPTFLYESLWLFLGFFLSLKINRHFLGFYCLWYGVGRFFLEFLRFDTAEIGGVKVAQVISLGLVALGIVLIERERRNHLLP